MAFLEGLAGGKDKIDNLRLPLQVALLISPIFLLQDAQMHLSSFYVQRYKIALVRIYYYNILLNFIRISYFSIQKHWVTIVPKSFQR